MKLVWRQKVNSDQRRRPYVPFYWDKVDRLPLCLYCKYISIRDLPRNSVVVCNRSHHYIMEYYNCNFYSISMEWNGLTTKCKWECGLFRLDPILQEEWTQYQILTDKLNAEMGHKRYPLPNKLELVL